MVILGLHMYTYSVHVQLYSICALYMYCTVYIYCALYTAQCTCAV